MSIDIDFENCPICQLGCLCGEDSLHRHSDIEECNCPKHYLKHEEWIEEMEGREISERIKKAIKKYKDIKNG